MKRVVILLGAIPLVSGCSAFQTVMIRPVIESNDGVVSTVSRSADRRSVVVVSSGKNRREYSAKHSPHTVKETATESRAAIEAQERSGAVPNTRFSSDGYRENNVARNGVAYSSGAYDSQPVWTINDGRRGSPYDASISQYAYWASSTTSTIYNCNYGNWWVSVGFQPEPDTICPFGPYGQECVHSISEIDLFSLQDKYGTGTNPTASTVTHNFGNVDFHLQYCRPGYPCWPTGSGWVDVPGGYVTFNNKAWTKISFPPVQATAVRAMLDCAQNTSAYVVELEAWTRIAPPACTFATIPNDNDIPYVNDDNSTASIIADSDRFWWKYFQDVPDIDEIDDFLSHNSPLCPGDCGISVWWAYGGWAQTLVQMYDLLAPVDFQRAMVYLERLRQMSNAFLKNRDDKRTGFPQIDQSPYPSPPYDVFHHQVMPAWGSVGGKNEGEFNGKWLAQVDMSGLFAYPMAAFARRVAEHPDWFCWEYRQDAIKFTTAVLETYSAFRQDMQFPDPNNPAWGYYLGSDRQQADPWNVTLSSLRSMVEVASAADSELYRSSSAAEANWFGIYYATQEAPRFIAKNVKCFLDYKCAETLGDGTTWYWWRYAKDIKNEQYPEDLSHAGLTLASLLLIWENRAVLDGLLARYGYSERVAGPTALNSTHFNNIANTFLRKIWYYDYTPGSDLHNLLTDRIDGPNSDLYCPRGCDDCSNAPIPSLGNQCGPVGRPPCKPLNANGQVAGFVGLAQFNPWVWVRSRDSIFNSALAPLPGCQGLGCYWPALAVDNHAALLRYRAWR